MAEPLRARAVYDCMIFLQGATRKLSPSGVCLHLAETGLVDLCLSDPILDEIGDVLRRPKLRLKFPILTEEFVERFLALVRDFSRLVSVVPTAFRYERDPKDEPYLNLAIAATADYLVSRDADILVLSDETSPDAQRLRLLVPEMRILDPVGFLQAARREGNA